MTIEFLTAKATEENKNHKTPFVPSESSAPSVAKDSPTPSAQRLTPGFTLLRANRDEYIILIDPPENLEELLAAWCEMDDAYCSDKLYLQDWQSIQDFLRSKDVAFLTPASTLLLADYYE